MLIIIGNHIMDNYPVYPEQEEGDDSDYKRNPYAPT
jgi:hypothetical protein